VGIQIYGRDPARMANAARIAEANGPDLVDINFGCPAKKVTGGGLRQPADARARADLRHRRCRETGDRPARDLQAAPGVGRCLAQRGGGLPRLQDLGVAGVTIHGRTRCQKYTGEADWAAIAAGAARPWRFPWSATGM
jgi:tRNA-dihydrouridine synthase B